MIKKHIYKKKYGQNFLKDFNLLKKIVEKANIENKNVIEIGPGKGAITKIIIHKAKKIIAYEIDKSLKPFLTFNSNYNIHIIYDDFLKRDLKADLKKYFHEEEIFLIGNLPYYIATPILFKILSIPQITSFTITVQKEVGLRILAKEKEKNYNSLSIFVQTLTKIQKIKIIKNTFFHPCPSVDGIVLKFDKISFESKEKKFIEKDFYKFLKNIFQQKRKTLLNNLNNSFKIPKEKILSFFVKYKIPLNIRAEEINKKRIFEIASFFYQFFKKSSNLNNK